MKKVVISGKCQATLADAAELQPKEDWVVVKVQAAPMCAEYKAFLAGKKLEAVGHEAAGEVVAVAQPGKVEVGDRVVAMPLYGCGKCSLCTGGDYIHCEQAPDFAELHGSLDGKGAMAQYILKPSSLLMPIPEDISYEKASLACCALGPSFGAFEAVGLSDADTVLITGAGPVGLGGVVNARFRGARPIVVESVPWRAERAKQLGAECVIDPGDANVLSQIMEMTEGKGVDCAVDCAGAVAAQRLCIDATRRKGKVAFVGQCHDALQIKITPDLLWKGLSLIGVWHYNLADYPRVLKVIQESPMVDALISHVLPMSKIQEAFELSASQETAKIILKPWE